MHSKKSAAIFLIVLILSLPVYSAQVIAAGYLRNQKLSGSEGVNGYIRYGDELTAEIEAKKDSGAVEPSDVKLESNPFDSCAEPAEGWKKCVNKIPSFSPTNYLSTYNIYLYESTTKLAQISGVSIIVDNLVPVIKQFNINTPVIGPATPLSYSYRIEDYAFTAGDVSKCSGIKEFKLYKQGNEAAALTQIPSDQTLCAIETSAQLTVEQLTPLGFANGESSLCIKARDRMNHPNPWSTETCKTININTAQPTLRGINIVGSKDNTVLLKSVASSLVVAVNLTSANGFTAGNVHANLASLNPSSADVIADACSQVQDMPASYYDCKFSVQTALTAPETTAQISISAADNVGNAQQGAASFAIKVDNTAPVVVSLTASTKGKDNSDVSGWLGSNPNKLTLTIQDPGFAKVSRENVKATFTGLRKLAGGALKSADVIADMQNEAGTEFYWNDLLCLSCVSGANTERVTVSVKDSAGNAIATPYSANFNVDRSAPNPRQAVFKDEQGSTTLQVNENVIIEVDVEEALSPQVFAVANLSNFRSGNVNHQATCTAKAEPGVFSCIWQGITVFDYKSYQDINFTFYDSLGNVINKFYKITDTSTPETTTINVLNQQTQEVSFVSTSTTDGKGDNTLFAVINDPGAGVSTESVSASLGGLSGDVKPDECRSTGAAEYTCYWRDRNCNGCASQIGITITATGLSSGLTYTKSATLPVDSFDPLKIGDVNVFVAGQPAKQFFEQGDSLIITTNFSDAHSTDSGFLKAVANLTELLGVGNDEVALNALVSIDEDIGNRANVCKEYQTNMGDCSRGKCYYCVWKAEDILGPKDNAKLKLTFFDKVNRSVSTEKSGLRLLVQSGQPGEFWKARLLETAPRQLDMVVLTYGARPVFYKLALDEKGDHAICKQFNVLNVDIKNCEYKVGDSDYATNVESGDVYGGESVTLTGSHPSIRSSEFYAKLIVDQEIQPAPLEVTSTERDAKKLLDSVDKKIPLNCTLTIQTQCNDNIFSEDEIVPGMDVYLYNNPLGTPDARIQKELDDVYNGFWIKQAGTLSSLRRLMDSAAKICEFIGISAKISLVFAALEDATKLLEHTSYKWIYESVKYTRNAWDNKVNNYVNTLHKYCEYISCKRSLWPGLYDWLDEHMWVFNSQKVAEEFGMFKREDCEKGAGITCGDAGATGQNGPNRAQFTTDFMKPENSLILSMATGCIPGVVYNLEKYRQIECSYYKCLRDYTKIGWPKFFCSSMRASSKCKYVYGQVFWTIPWTAFADYAMNVVKDFFANPLSVMFLGIDQTCSRLGNNKATGGLGDLGSTACSVQKALKIISAVNEAREAWRQTKDWKFQQPLDFCKELDKEIKAGGPVSGGPA